MDISPSQASIEVVFKIPKPTLEAHLSADRDRARGLNRILRIRFNANSRVLVPPRVLGVTRDKPL